METLLQLDHPFTFACGPELPCFTVCCSDLDLLLTPYDLLRLQRRLGLSSEQFLAGYTERQLRERVGLPLLFLRMREDEKKSCPFLTPRGCAVYSDRPLSCRLYPLGLVPPGSEAGFRGEEFLVIAEPHCEGHRAGRTWPVREWLADQCPGDYLELGREFNRLCFDLKLREQPLTLEPREIFYTVAYNRDRFRKRICENGRPEPPTDDPAFLRFALSRLRSPKGSEL